MFSRLYIDLQQLADVAYYHVELEGNTVKLLDALATGQTHVFTDHATAEENVRAALRWLCRGKEHGSIS